MTPNVYTTLEEIDTFVTAMEDAAKNGVPVTQGQAPSPANEMRAEKETGRVMGTRAGATAVPGGRRLDLLNVRSAAQAGSDFARVPIIRKALASRDDTWRPDGLEVV